MPEFKEDQFKPKVLIVGRTNQHRSQMLEGLLRDRTKLYGFISAGLEPAQRLDARAVKVMEEIDIDIFDQEPKPLSSAVDEHLRLIVYVDSRVTADAPVISAQCEKVELNLPEPTYNEQEDPSVLTSFRKLREHLISRTVPKILEKLDIQVESS